MVSPQSYNPEQPRRCPQPTAGQDVRAQFANSLIRRLNETGKSQINTTPRPRRDKTVCPTVGGRRRGASAKRRPLHSANSTMVSEPGSFCQAVGIPIGFVASILAAVDHSHG